MSTLALPGQRYYVETLPPDTWACCGQCEGRVWAPYELILYPAEAQPLWVCLRHLPALFLPYVWHTPEWLHDSRRPCSDIQQADPLRSCAVTFAVHDLFRR